MFQNYIKTLIRTFQKNKLATTINVVGLTVAFACAILLLLRVYYEFSFDQSYPDKDRLFKVYQYVNTKDGQKLSASMPFPIQEALVSEDIGVAGAATFVWGGSGVRYNGKEVPMGTVLVGSDFFNMFSLPVKEGNKQLPLGSANDIVLTKRSAINLFNNENAIGKKVEANIQGQWLPLTVSAVMDDLPSNSSLWGEAFASVTLHPSYPTYKNQWNWTATEVYLQLKPSVSANDFEKKLLALGYKYGKLDTTGSAKDGLVKDKEGNYMGLKLLPVTEMHFSSEIGSGNVVNKSFLYVLSLVAIVMLLIATFNFINLNIGLSFQRTKEIGVRKCLGAQKKQVWLQVWTESLSQIGLSALAGTGLALLLIKKFNQLFNANISGKLLTQPFVWVSLMLLIVLISFLASGYPSALLARLKTTEVLKGKLTVKRSGVLRNGLIVTQFVIAMLLICSTIIIYQQFQHLRKAPLGYNTEAIISVPIKETANGRQIVSKMRTLLSNQSAIESVTASSVNLGLGKDGGIADWNFGFDFNGKQLRTGYVTADLDFLKTMGMTPLLGRDFSSRFIADISDNVIITQSLAKQLAPENPIGQKITFDSAKAPWVVVGVIPDFQLYSMFSEKQPLTIGMNHENLVSYVLVRVNTQNPSAVMELVKGAYKEAEPNGDFAGSFVNENTDRWYHAEKSLSKMFTVATIVAILLSCMGLFGMAFIVVGQRTKEIGVRKVLGASASGIAALVSKEFIKPVLIAVIIATPIALWMLNKWLQHFTYRVSISWWVFAAAGAVALIIAILTISIQAVRASYTNPVKTLRSE